MLAHGDPEPQQTLKSQLVEEGYAEDEKIYLMEYGKVYHLYKEGMEITTFCIDTHHTTLNVDPSTHLKRKEISKLEKVHDSVIALLDERFLSREYEGLFPREWSDRKMVIKNSMSKEIEKFWMRKNGLEE